MQGEGVLDIHANVKGAHVGLEALRSEVLSDLGGSSSVDSAAGTCTDSKMVKCVLRLTDRSLGKNYGLIFGIDN